MRNILIKIAYTIGVFVATVLVTSAITGSHGSATTQTLAKATLPVVTFLRDGDVAFNEVHGYTTARDPGSYRADITPVSSDRQIRLSIDPYGQQVTHLTYELRDITGERLIDSQDASGFYVLDGGVTRVSFTLGNLMTEGTEYLLVLRISTTDVPEALFYTRVVYAAESDYGENELQYNRVLDFVQQLHDETYEKDNRSKIATYIAMDDDSGVDDYGHVSYGSSYDEVTWGELSPTIVIEPIWTITDIQQNVYGVEAYYMVEITDEEADNAVIRCDVHEYYRLYEGSDRFHVLDYDRIMDATGDVSGGIATSDQVDLGIAGSGITAQSSEEGGYTAYVQDGRLYLCAASERALSYIYGFAEADSLDRRDTWRDSDIKILRVDDEGNVDFLVYGYMNRGSHEGTVGAAAYHYDNAQRTIRELAYIAYSGSASMLEAQLESASYLAQDGRLYLMLEGQLLRIDTTSAAVADVRQSGLQERDVAVSDSGEYVAWREEDGSITLTDLEDLSQRSITVSSGETAIPLGFIGEDLIYGIARNSDIEETQTDGQLRPMYTVQIVDHTLHTLEDYQADGYYVSDCVIGEGQITLQRMEQQTDANGRVYYVRAEDDQILSGAAQSAGSAGITSGSDSLLGRVSTLQAKGLDAENVRYYRPNEILYEGAHNVVLASAAAEISEAPAHYGVYNYQGLVTLVYDAREAIGMAVDASGVVVDQSGQCLWQSQFRSVAEIEDISRVENVAIAEDTVAACVAEITEYVGNPQTAETLAGGQGAMSIADAATALETYVEGTTVCNLSGLSMDNVLYYVSIYHPVLAMTSGSTAVLIVGYSDTNIILYDPAAGGRVVTTRNNAQSRFLAGGSRYLIYY